MSHQLKTPLTSISIMLDNLDGEINTELKQEFLKDIKREVKKLKQNIMTYSIENS